MADDVATGHSWGRRIEESYPNYGGWSIVGGNGVGAKSVNKGTGRLKRQPSLNLRPLYLMSTSEASRISVISAQHSSVVLAIGDGYKPQSRLIGSSQVAAS